MSVINTNITSMIAQQNLNDSKGALETNMERLSSGLRINSAKDDAAGQAIANRFEAQTTGLAQAQRNASDGISVAQTAEGALDQINDNVQRVRELTVQAANDTNSPDDLDSIQDEIDERLSEIDRVSEQTDFNGTKVLDKDAGELNIQVGANDGEQITIDLKEINVGELGMDGFNVNNEGEVANEAATEESLKLADGVEKSTGVGDYTLQEANTAATGADVLGQLAKNDTVDVTSDGGGTAQTDATNLGFDSGTITGTLTSDGEGNLTTDVTEFAEGDAATMLTGTADAPTAATYTFDGGSQDIQVDSTGNITDADGNQLHLSDNNELTLNDGGASSSKATATNLTAAVAADDGGTGNSKIAIADGPTLSANGADDSELTIKDASLTNEQVTSLADDNGQYIETGVQVGSNDITIQDDGSVEDSTTNDSVYVDGDNTLVTDEFTETELFVREDNEGIITDEKGSQYFTDQEGKLTTEDVTVKEGTVDPLATLDEALGTIDGMRSNLGAVQNRFESAITNLSTNETNLSDAQSRIEDVDYASEVAEMTKNQILQQAGTSVLAQANQLPQNALSLLG